MSLPSEVLSSFERARRAEQASLLSRSGLFDEEYYLEQLSARFSQEFLELSNDRGATPNQLVEHFLRFGDAAGLDPHPLFCTKFYLTYNSFSSSQPISEEIPAVIHYLGSTGKEAYKPHPLFDTDYYLAKSQNLNSLAPKMNPLLYFLRLDTNEEKSPHTLFDSAYYLAQLSPGPEREAVGANALLHYLKTGYKQGLNPHCLFDSAFYWSQLSPSSSNSSNSPSSLSPSYASSSPSSSSPHSFSSHVPQPEPLGHYLMNPDKAKLSPHPLFVPDYYLSQLLPGHSAQENPLQHFLENPEVLSLSPHPAFDAHYYAECYPDLKKLKVPLFLHYLRYGYLEGRNPNGYFQSRWYLQRNAAASKKNQNSLAAYISTPENMRPQAHPFIDSQGEFNPLLGASAAQACGWQVCEWDSAFDALMKFAQKPFTHLFIIPGLVRAGGERAACSFIKYCQDKHGVENVLVLMADYFEHSTQHWLSENTRLFDVRKLLPASYSAADMALLLATFIACRRPLVTHIINSFSGMSALSGYGQYLQEENGSVNSGNIAKNALRSKTENNTKGKFVVYLFGYETYTDNACALLKHPIFNSALAAADCVITDTRRLSIAVRQYVPTRVRNGKTTRECYLFSEHLDRVRAKFRSQSSSLAKVTEPKVLWASRITKSKRPDILVEIARQLPDIKFVVYGSAELESEELKTGYLKLLTSAENIVLAGDFSDFGDLELRSYSLFLYTSQGDGIPLVLLEAVCAGLPIVAPNVGGIGEFLSNENSWFIERYDDVDSYVNAVKDALVSRDLALQKTERLFDLLAKQHSRGYFETQLSQLAEYF